MPDARLQRTREAYETGVAFRLNKITERLKDRPTLTNQQIDVQALLSLIEEPCRWFTE
jgi:hypothetical protein